MTNSLKNLAAILSVLLLGVAMKSFAQAPASPFVVTVPPASDRYLSGPDSQRHAGVPEGKTFAFQMTVSKIYPGTVRTITVYVPAAYTGEKAACVYVGLDGLGFKAPIVFDNLIAQHAMPVTIGIGLSPGVVPSAQAPDNPRFDRSFEFDSRNGRLACFVLEEVLPAVKRHLTPDGKPILLSDSGNDRAIGGGSTGAIGAFTAAWERPDAFRRVFSAIGTYVGMRGGESYYVLVRKTEPKPLRIFMQDGVHDEWPGGPEMGDWWMSNQTMERALEFAGYDVRHVWGVGTHNDSQGTSLFPEAMRWLWRDWPAPVPARASGNPVLQAIVPPDEHWQVVAEGCPSSTTLAANPDGDIFTGNGKAQQISNTDPAGKASCGASGAGGAIAFGQDGSLYAADEKQGGEITVSRGKRKSVAAKGLPVRSFTVRNNGDIYVTTEDAGGQGELWLVRANGQKTRLDEGLKQPAGVALSPDGLWLFVDQEASRAGISYRVQKDGSVDSRAPFYDFYVPAWADDSGAAGMAMDEDGRAYVATRMGVQVFDRNGRVTAILPLPGNAAAASVCFGGKDFRTLYVAGSGKIYRRRLRVAGAPPWASPRKLSPWGAG